MEEDPDVKELRECAEEAVGTTSAPSTRPPQVWEQNERDGHVPKLPDCPVCVHEHGSVVRNFASNSSRPGWEHNMRTRSFACLSSRL